MTVAGRRVSRRHLIRGIAAGAVGLAGAALLGCGGDADEPGAGSALQDDLLARLSYNTASGGGVNIKRMPHPETGEPTVELEEIFSFDRHHALCRVDTNPQAFVMPTHALGDVLVQPHEFFMAMYATSIEQFEITSHADGTTSVIMRGGLDCATEVGRAESRLGDRGASEHATYRIEATDAGIGGGAAGDRFAFTAFFDEEEAPVNFQIFGPEFVFTGEMVRGEISIVDPRS